MSWLVKALGASIDDGKAIVKDVEDILAEPPQGCAEEAFSVVWLLLMT